jgi:hypothetical protein
METDIHRIPRNLLLLASKVAPFLTAGWGSEWPRGRRPGLSPGLGCVICYVATGQSPAGLGLKVGGALPGLVSSDLCGL